MHLLHAFWIVLGQQLGQKRGKNQVLRLDPSFFRKPHKQLFIKLTGNNLQGGWKIPVQQKASFQGTLIGMVDGTGIRCIDKEYNAPTIEQTGRQCCTKQRNNKQ